jgi:micrococcal nuclease
MRLTRQNIRLIKSLLIVILTIWGSVSVVKHQPWTQNNDIVSVVKVKDGDSIVVKTNKGNKDLRIWGIDAPEHGQPYAEESKQRLKELVLNNKVRVQNPKTDDFQRDLAFIYIANKDKSQEQEVDVGSTLIKEGLAWHFNPDPEHDKPYKLLQTEAKNKKLGLWKDPNPQNPEDYRREQKNKSPRTFKLKKNL